MVLTLFGLVGRGEMTCKHFVDMGVSKLPAIRACLCGRMVGVLRRPAAEDTRTVDGSRACISARVRAAVHFHSSIGMTAWTRMHSPGTLPPLPGTLAQQSGGGASASGCPGVA